MNEPLMRNQASWVASSFLTPDEVAAILPNTSAKSVRDWCGDGKLRGAIQLPSGRWQIPWAAVIGILGFDPRDVEGPVSASSPGTPGE